MQKGESLDMIRKEYSALSCEIPILVYHQIYPPQSSKPRSECGISVKQFENQMRYLQDHGFQCISLNSLLKEPHPKTRWGDRRVVVTFDDGYEDFLDSAFPILQRYNFTATIFLVADCIGGKGNWAGQAGGPLLNWRQIRALANEGIEFGSHTCTHPYLISLPEKEVWHELTQSKKRIEDGIGLEVNSLAYPYGESNAAIRNLVAEAGYQGACGEIDGRLGRFNLWRCPCKRNMSMIAFACMLSVMYLPLKRIRRWVRNETALGNYLCLSRYIQRDAG